MASSTSKCRGCLNKANYFCCVCGTSQQLHSVEQSLPSSEALTFTIWTVKLVIRKNLGLHTSVVNPAIMD